MTAFTVASAVALHEKAHAAGMAAGNGCNPTPMTVFTPDIHGGPLEGTPIYHVPSGVCGFAWVSFAGNTSFGRCMKKAGLADKGSYGGLSVWVGEFGQSMDRKASYAAAYANVLREAGIEARAQSRMD